MSNKGYLLFDRGSRIPRLPAPLKITIVGPLASRDRGVGGFLMRWGSIILALVSIAVIIFVTVNYNTVGNALPFLLPLCVTTGGTALIGFVAEIYQSSQIKKELKIFNNQLNTSRQQLEKYSDLFQTKSNEINPPPSRLIEVVQDRKYLWERLPEDEDFLHIRLGIEKKSRSNVQFELININDKTLVKSQTDQAALTLHDNYKYVDNVPALFDLPNQGALAITGKPELSRDLVRSMVCQIVTNHSPEDVRFLAFYPTERASDWFWLGWLPHTASLLPRDENYSQPMLAYETERVNRLLNWLSKTLVERETQAKNFTHDQKKGAAIIVLFDYTEELRRHRPLINTLVEKGVRHNIFTILMMPEGVSAPAHCYSTVQFNDTGMINLAIREVAGPGGVIKEIDQDSIDLKGSTTLARLLSPIRLQDKTGEGNLPELVDLFDIMKFTELTPETLSDRWHKQRKVNLEIILGVGANGLPVTLNLAERVHGTHGMVVGRTGSGKGELLLNLVTNLVLNNDPTKLNLVLADFKGGATFSVFEKLPHCVGFVTDLEKGGELEVVRVIASLERELSRREELIAKAQKIHGSGVQRIEQYQEVSSTLPDLPYLIVIIDEFAKMSSIAPERVRDLAQIGMRGRSLGVFLLLSMQNPQGLIKGELDTNLRYRICLKVNSPDESLEVLRDRAAFENLNGDIVGRGFFRCDSELKIFQGARVMGHWFNRNLLPKTLPDSTKVARLEMNWDRTELIKPREVADSQYGSDPSVVPDVEVLVGVCQSVANQNPKFNFRHKPWLPPLPTCLPFTRLLPDSFDENDRFNGWPEHPAFGWMTIPYAKTDLYWQQEQPLLVADLSFKHLQFVGSPESGRSQALLAAVLTLATQHQPGEIDFYLFDFSIRLKHFEALPHETVYFAPDEGKERYNLLEDLNNEIERRRHFFKNVTQGTVISNLEDYRKYCLEQGIPVNELEAAQIIVIDNFAAWKRYDDYDKGLGLIRNIVQNGPAYGIHVLLATNKPGDFDAGRMWDAFYSVMLQMDPDDLITAPQDRKMLGLWQNKPGRGFVTGVQPHNLIETQCITIVQGEMREQIAGLQHIVADIKAFDTPKFSLTS